MKRIFFIIACIACFILETDAQVINIPADQTTIQAGIDLASTGDTVLVAEGTYFENINFKGKAITVASQFILDGDTSHISGTIIDGSQSVNPDTASVVTLWSGEDTTSVLMGFTITGGAGTYYSEDGWSERGGGGVFIKGSGGLIAFNIIEGNHVEKEGAPEMQSGGGIFAFLYDNHSVLIRKNIIRENTVKGESAGGGGINVFGGRIVCEFNEIINNSAIAEGWVYGGGMMGHYADGEGVIREAIIRNNLISGNLASTNTARAGGGGYYQNYGFGEGLTMVYNNVISNNHATYIGGGVFFWNDAQASVFNNTIVDNTAVDNGNNVVVVASVKLSLYNNIIWTFENNDVAEFALFSTEADKFQVFHNIMKQPFKPEDGVNAFDNSYLAPVFEDDSFNLAENSPGIGLGIDSLNVDGSWYYAPSVDYFENPRPNPIDGRVDMGAIESPYEGIVSIPDTAFLYSLIDGGVDTNGDSLISFTEAEAISSLRVGGEGWYDGQRTPFYFCAAPSNISDLSGIEAFRNLDTLVCHCSQLEVLNTSENKELAYLDCSGNQIIDLDLSNNIALTFLDCSENQIAKLDVSSNNLLTGISCSQNQIPSLDLSNHSALRRLNIASMPTLNEVCVWTMPFPPEGVDVNITDSPNVCFTSNCGSCFNDMEEFTQTWFSIYPNPTNDLLYIETGYPDHSSINITTLNGQLVYNGEMEGSTKQIDLSSFKEGVYLITIKAEDFVTTRKVIKL